MRLPAYQTRYHTVQIQDCPLLQEEAKKYPNAKIVWCQEETKNAGAWSYVNPRIRTAMRAAREVIITCLVPLGDRVFAALSIYATR